MQFLLLGLALLVIVLLGGRAFANADPKALAKLIRQATGWGAIAVAVLLGVTGRFAVALPLAIFGISILGRSFPWPGGLGDTAKSTGQRSSVRTDMLEMTLDHDTGRMEGTVLKGQFAGQPLSSLSADQLGLLLGEVRRLDPQATQLLEAFIERTQQTRSNGQQHSQRGRSGSAAMTIEEAYAVLGLSPGATRDDIQQAHRALMKKYHPDQGGTTYLASKINEAKDVLLRQVRN
jgi:hypothetical protein